MALYETVTDRYVITTQQTCYTTVVPHPYLELLHILSTRPRSLQALKPRYPLLQLQRFLKPSGSACQQLIKHMVAPLALSLVDDARLLQEVILDLTCRVQVDIDNEKMTLIVTGYADVHIP